MHIWGYMKVQAYMHIWAYMKVWAYMDIASSSIMSVLFDALVKLPVHKPDWQVDIDIPVESPVVCVSSSTAQLADRVASLTPQELKPTVQRCPQSSHSPDFSEAGCVSVWCLLYLTCNKWRVNTAAHTWCPNTEEPRAVPLSMAKAQTALAPADQLWSTNRDQAVRLRMEGSGPASETPITVHQLFMETVENYGDRPALVSKTDGQWVTLTWRQYYEQCRAAAKSFLKVCLTAT